jgi:hypothetical protein
MCPNARHIATLFGKRAPSLQSIIINHDRLSYYAAYGINVLELERIVPQISGTRLIAMMSINTLSPFSMLTIPRFNSGNYPRKERVITYDSTIFHGNSIVFHRNPDGIWYR